MAIIWVSSVSTPSKPNSPPPLWEGVGLLISLKSLALKSILLATFEEEEWSETDCVEEVDWTWLAKFEVNFRV